MRSLTAFLTLFLCFPAVAAAKPKQFRILGDQKITAEVHRGIPLPAEKDGVTIEIAAFMVQESQLTFTFGLNSDHPLERVLVEDVTDAKAVILLDDTNPKRAWTYWKGNAAPVLISRDTLPWIWRRGDSTKIFRFTVWVTDRDEPIVVFQPAVYPAGTKKLIQEQA